MARFLLRLATAARSSVVLRSAAARQAVDVRTVYITGGAGSGKTTLARELSAVLGVRHYDVDRGELPPRGTEGWIVEGAHVWAMGDFVEAADEVVWLDLPARVSIPRILLRHLRLTLAGTNRHPGIGNLLRFAAAQPDHYRKPARAPTGPTDWGALSRSATERLLAGRRGPITILRTPREVRRWRRAVGIRRRSDLGAGRFAR